MDGHWPPYPRLWGADMGNTFESDLSVSVGRDGFLTDFAGVLHSHRVLLLRLVARCSRRPIATVQDRRHLTSIRTRDRLLRSSFFGLWPPVDFLVRAALLGVWLLLDVCGFRPVLARGWHEGDLLVRTCRHGRVVDRLAQLIRQVVAAQDGFYACRLLYSAAVFIGCIVGCPVSTVH